ncbi:MAG: hypothetical protein IIC73_05070 [Armatimonadetes bacterium]|nr:hypothetical protein [Armatimonadota bacterium]
MPDVWEILHGFDPNDPSDGPEDLDDLVASIRKNVPPVDRHSPSRARALVEREAQEVRALVEEERLAIFGDRAAPFQDALAAAEWTESEVEPLESYALSVTLQVPKHLEELDALRWFRDWLDEHLPPKQGAGDTGSLFDFMGTDGLRGISSKGDVLPYLPPAAESQQEIWMRQAATQHGSDLWKLLQAARRVAAVTGWALVAAVHHLLTDGLIAGNVAWAASLHSARTGAADSWLPPREQIEIRIGDPPGAIDDDVKQATREGRAHLLTGRQRGSRTSRSVRAAAFVRDHPDIGWQERLELWNSEYPDDLFVSKDALRHAAKRGPGAKGGHLTPR